MRTASFLAALFSAAATALIAAPAVSAQTAPAGLEAPAPAALGPAIGAPAPAALPVAAGKTGTVAVFVRSVDWCPFCKRQLTDLALAAEALAEQGWTVAAISYDSAETQAAFKARHDLPMAFVSDEGSELIKAYGLLDASHAPGSRAHGIPYPAIVFLSPDGVVDAVLREEGYRTRPEGEVVLEKATALASERAG